MNLLKITSKSGKRVAINPRNIQCIREVGEKETDITFVSHIEFVTTCTPFDEVVQKLESL